MASIIASLDIAKAVDKDGKVIEPEVDYDASIVRPVIIFSFISATLWPPCAIASNSYSPFRMPKGLKCAITPRSVKTSQQMEGSSARRDN
jgi:hypothetical protein